MNNKKEDSKKHPATNSGRIKQNEKHLPIATFSLNLPMNFSISGSRNLKDELDKEFSSNRRVGLSRFLKQRFLKELFDINSEVELFSRNTKFPDIKKSFDSLRESILNNTIEPNELIKWENETVKAFLESVRDKRGENK